MAIPATCAKLTETIHSKDSTRSWMPLVTIPVVTFSILANLLQMNSSTFNSILAEGELVKQANFPNHFRFLFLRFFEFLQLQILDVIMLMPTNLQKERASNAMTRAMNNRQV